MTRLKKSNMDKVVSSDTNCFCGQSQPGDGDESENQSDTNLNISTHHQPNYLVHRLMSYRWTFNSPQKLRLHPNLKSRGIIMMYVITTIVMLLGPSFALDIVPLSKIGSVGGRGGGIDGHGIGIGRGVGIGASFYHRDSSSDFYTGSSQQSEYEGQDDMIMTCSRPVKSSRAAKYLAIKQLDIPCDMGDKKSAWCNLPGDKYPWHAVRRFVFENQGLMRRMYGEVRQLSLLRMEFEDDLDDEEEEDRRGPHRGSPPEDHRRNSILTEVLDESLPRVLSESPPEDQLLLRDHLVRSTPRSLSPYSTPHSVSSSETSVPLTSEEQVKLLNETTEAMMGVTIDSVSGEVNTTTGESDAPEGGVTTVEAGGSVRLLADEVVTETVTPAAAVGTTEVDNSVPISTSDGSDDEKVGTTTEEISTIEDTDGAEVQPIPAQQLNDGLDIGASIGSDESHDFLNLDKNHILYFDDVGKNRRPVGGGGDNVGGFQPQQQQAQGKLKAVNACPVKEEVVAPYWANNTRGEILALLNLYPFEQYIHWERCNHENKQMFCRQGCRCEQQYRLHRLLAFDPTNECRGIFSDWFRFPSCCVCRCYLNEYELMMLNAAGQEPSASVQSKSRTSDRIRSPRKILLDQLVDGPDVQGVDDMHFFYKQGFYAEHNHGAQPR